ncbi:hypothetical protein [Altererythrobacter sp.]|uniref:hypothetical protein n=1 Tax=Altererythrobacter sp. TaxID=1872480 RepID=UPI003CFCF9EC
MRLALGLTALAALSLSGTALAKGYIVNLEPANAGIVYGHGGLHAVDEKTEVAHIRIVSPGLRVGKRGTIRVLVKNLGKTEFEFGPDDVKLTLADGTELPKVPFSEFDKGYTLIKREQNRAAAVQAQNYSTLGTLIGQTQTGVTAGSINSASTPSGTLAGAPVNADDLRQSSEDEYAMPGGKTLDALYQVLIPEVVAPMAASGGYLVFDIPKELQSGKSDLPVTITVRTGSKVNQFKAVLEHR